MRSHMTAGAIALLLGPIQFIPVFRKRPSLRGIHRWSGRLFCTCGMVSSIFGLWFIALKQQLVGGYNMTASFTLAGAAIGYTSFMTWKTARAARFNTNIGSSLNTSKSFFVRHRNYGIRAYAQILAPALYRYWYVMMDLFNLYNVPVPIRMGGYCDANDQCPDYSRPWDSIYTWLYWLSAGIVAEIIILYLPSHDGSQSSNDDTNLFMTQQEGIVPLLRPLSTRNTEESEEAASTEDVATSTYGSEHGHRNTEENESFGINDLQQDELDRGTPLVVNMIGWLLAVIAIVITGKTLYTVFAQ